MRKTLTWEYVLTAEEQPLRLKRDNRYTMNLTTR